MKGKAAGTALAGVLLTLLASVARAEPDPPPKPSGLAIHVQPVFGIDAAGGYGWNDYVARLDNASSTPIKGTLEMSSRLAYGEVQELTTRTTFNAPAGRSVIVHLPTHGYAGRPSTLSVVAHGEDGAALATQTLSPNGTIAPLLVDVEEPSRLSVVLRNASVPVTWAPMNAYGPYGGGATTASSLTVGAPAFDRATGDPVLPEQAAGYGLATVVLIHSDVLARLDAGALEALVDWVLGGGSLAVVPTRPEDLRSPTLAALVGGAATVGPPASVLATAFGRGSME